MIASDARAGRGEVWLGLLVFAAAALWIDFGTIHRGHTSDSLIFPLASLYVWTPFFWEQDRVGLLVPLVTSWCRDPWANLLLQVGLTTFMGLSVPWLVMSYLTDHPAGRLAAAVGGAVFLAAAPPVVRDNVLFVCYYPTALFLGGVGLHALGRPAGYGWLWRPAVALACFLLAHWVYAAAVLVLAPLVAWRAWLMPPRRPGSRWWVELLRPVTHRHPVVAVVLLALAAAGGYGLMVWGCPDRSYTIPTPTDGLDPSDWADTWSRYPQEVAKLDGAPAWLALLGGMTAVGLAARCLVRPAGGFPLLRVMGVLVLTAACESLLIGTRDWPARNEYHPRYILGGLLLLQLAAAAAAVYPLASLFAGRYRGVVWPLALVVLLGGAAAQYGLPSPATARACLDQVAGTHTTGVRAAGADAIGGSYWTVWPAVFHANMVSREEGSDKQYFGVCFRSQPWRPLWERSHPDGFRLAVLDGDRKAALKYADEYGLSPPEYVGSVGGVEVYRTRPDGHPIPILNR